MDNTKTTVSETAVESLPTPRFIIVAIVGRQRQAVIAYRHRDRARAKEVLKALRDRHPGKTVKFSLMALQEPSGRWLRIEKLLLNIQPPEAEPAPEPVPAPLIVERVKRRSITNDQRLAYLQRQR